MGEEAGEVAAVGSVAVVEEDGEDFNRGCVRAILAHA